MLLDKYLKSFQFSEQHAIQIHATSEKIIKSITTVEIDDDVLIRCMLKIRELPSHLFPQWRSQSKAMSLDCFCLLQQNENELVYGLIGRFWHANYGLVDIASSDEFLNYQEPETPKLGLGYRIVSVGERVNQLVTETRVFCPDAVSLKKFTPYWYLIRIASGLIRRRMLKRIKRQCEAGK